MALASVIEVSAPFSSPRVIDLKVRSYNSIPPGTIASELIEIELPAVTPEQSQRRLLDEEVPKGKAYVIDLAFFSINCASEDYDARIFSRNDSSAADTLWEDIVYTGVDKSIDDIFERFILKNSDIVKTNKLYVLVENYGSVATGNIDIEFTYVVLDDQG